MSYINLIQKMEIHPITLKVKNHDIANGKVAKTRLKNAQTNLKSVLCGLVLVLIFAIVRYAIN